MGPRMLVDTAVTAAAAPSPIPVAGCHTGPSLSRVPEPCRGWSGSQIKRWCCVGHHIGDGTVPVDFSNTVCSLLSLLELHQLCHLRKLSKTSSYPDVLEAFCPSQPSLFSFHSDILVEHSRLPVTMKVKGLESSSLLVCKIGSKTSVLHKYRERFLNQLEKKLPKVKFPLSTLNTGFIPCDAPYTSSIL